MLARWRERVRALREEVHALLLAYRDPRVPWHARLLVAAVVAYALSPIDLIPDFIPVLGYLDDLLLVPLGIALAARLVPPEVLAECRERARSGEPVDAPLRWIAAAFVAALWTSVAVYLLLAFLAY